MKEFLFLFDEYINDPRFAKRTEIIKETYKDLKEEILEILNFTITKGGFSEGIFQIK
jgi:hypothetical protein